MALKLKYSSRARFWAEIVMSEGAQVFVPTNDALPPGAAVTVEIECTELPEPLETHGTVQGSRPATPTSAGGVIVNLDAASVHHARNATSGPRDDHARTVGRTEERIDCQIPTRVLTPFAVDGCLIKTISVGGATLLCKRPVAISASLGLELDLPDGKLICTGTVAWVRTELSLAGIRFGNLEASGEQRLKMTVESFRKNKPAPVPPGAATVFVADDDPSILDFMSLVISKAGFRVLRAARGDTALTLIRQERPKLIFLDVLMPGLDGMEVCKALRTDANFAKIPIVLLSAMGEDKVAQAARSATASDYLTKPMHLETVRALLAKYL